VVCIGGHFTMDPEHTAYAMRELVRAKTGDSDALRHVAGQQPDTGRIQDRARRCADQAGNY
jgi:hypothetical protein